MRKKICSLFFLLCALIQAEDIYIGDKINLKIKNISEKEIKHALKDWEIVAIKPQKDETIVTFKGYTPGDKKILFGGKEIPISIKSSLTAEEASKKDQEIFMDLTDKSNKNLGETPFPYLSLIGGFMGLLSFIFLIKELMRRKDKVLSPSGKFKIGIQTLDVDRWNFQISELLREYIDAKYISDFKKGIYTTFGEITAEDVSFLKDLDTMKFSGGRAGGEKFQNMEYCVKRALEIFNRIEEREVEKNV